MRNQDDILIVRFDVSGSVSLDMERVEQDPVWMDIARQADITTEPSRTNALLAYVNIYLSRSTLLEDMPSTNGPADLFGARVSVVQPNART